mgnify:CR=1 FL=1
MSSNNKKPVSVQLSGDFAKEYQKITGTTFKQAVGPSVQLSQEYTNELRKAGLLDTGDDIYRARFDDIGPVRKRKEEEEEEDDGLLDFFQKGSFKDGYQKWDVTKAILGTAGDAALNVAKGAAGLGEGIGDAVWYGIAGVADAMGKDAWADTKRKAASENLVEKYTKGASDYLDKYSVLGRTSDAILQGIGQVGGIMATGGAGAAAGFGAAGTTALTTGTMFASGFGSSTGEALKDGATTEEAVTYGAIAGAADAITELIFGGLGKAVKATGLSTGLSSADDMLAKKVSGLFTNQIAKNISEFGIKAGAEGLEEVLAGIAQAAGKKATYMSEEEFGEILKDENLLEQFVVGSVTSGIIQSGLVPGTSEGSLKEANKEGRDFITGQSQNEQAVIKKEVEKRIAQEEKDGKKTLTKKERSAIEYQVEQAMERGDISIETIEEALGGDTYKSYREAVDKENEVIKEFAELYKGDELKQQVQDFLDKSESKTLREKLAQEVAETVKGDRLIESYNERARRKQAFQADLSKYDEKQKAVIRKAVESKVLNNTRKTHEFVDFVAKMSADTGASFDFVNNEKLKGSKYAVEGKTVNGFVDEDGRIVLNTDSSESRKFVVGHEITHVLEGTDLYQHLQDTIFEYAKSKKSTDSKFANEYMERLYYTRQLYKDIDSYQGVQGFQKIKREVVADLVGEYVFSDANFVNNLSTKNRNVFQKMYDEVKYMLKLATAGSKEAKELEKVKRAFEDAYRAKATKADAKTDANTDKETGAKYSIVEDKKTLEFLDGQELVKVYRAMQEIDGELYPPMAAKMKGESGKKSLVEPTKKGAWYQSDERPDLIKFEVKQGKKNRYLTADEMAQNAAVLYGNPSPDDVIVLKDGSEVKYGDLKYKFELDKANGASVPAAYNPYFHASGTPLNDQFSSAYDRPNLRVVEGYIPKSELDSGYKAMYAKDSVGETSWHAGPVASQLKGDKARRVFLSRWFKVDRVIPDAEAAKLIAKTLEGENLTVPWNVVTPSLRKALEAEGITIDYKDIKAGSKTVSFESTQKDVRYSISPTTDGRFAAVVDNDILSNIDTSSWDDAKKTAAKKAAADALKQFKDGIVVDGITRKVNKISRREYTRSNYTESLYSHAPEVFADKMRAADVADDIVVAATNWHRDGGLKHPRSDNFVDFDHGNTLIVSGDRKYSAEVVVGITDTGEAVFYDVVDMTPTAFDIKKEESPTTATTQNAIGDIHGDSSGGIVAQDGKNVNYSLSDSSGRKLSMEQQDYFKDSKVRDEEGNLKVMYHGTPNGNFTVFKDGTYFTDNKEYADRYQNPGASSISSGKVASNPKTFEVYLDIKKPFDLSDAEAREIYINEYIKGGNAMGINPYLSDAEYAKINTIDWTEGEDLRDFLIDNEYDYDGLVLDEGADGGYGDEVKSRGKSYVVFSPEQVKNVDNAKPTADPDVRFSMSKSVEETKDLIAVHNLHAAELAETLKLSGLPSPSVAIIKAKDGHEKYGDVSLILPKDSIDPKANKANRIYGSDAWTPTRGNAPVEYEVNYDTQRKFERDVEQLSKNVANGIFSKTRVLGMAGIEGSTDKNLKEIAEKISDYDSVRAAYIAENGGNVDVVYREKVFDNYGNDALKSYVAKVGEQEVARLAVKMLTGERLMASEIETAKDAMMDSWIAKHEYTLKQKPALRETRIAKFRERITDLRAEDFVRNAWEFYENAGETSDLVDYGATGNNLRAAAERAEVAAWVEQKLQGLLGGPAIYNGKDPFTSSGKRRSFKEMHWEYTAENIVKAMNNADARGANVMHISGEAVIATATPEYKNIDEVRADKDRLLRAENDVYERIKDEISKELQQVTSGIVRTTEHHSDNQYDEEQIIGSVIMEAAQGKKTAAGVKQVFRKNGYTIGDSQAKAVLTLFDHASKVPTEYFEAKPQRVVGFDEVGVYVIPYDADVQLKQELLNRGYAIAEYDPKVEGDRQRVVNQFEEFKFSLSNVGEQRRPASDPLSDLRYEGDPVQAAEQDIAPVRAAAPVQAAVPGEEPAEENSTVQAQTQLTEENSTVSDMEMVEDILPDSLQPVQEELTTLLQEKEEIENRLYALTEAGDFGEEFNALSAEWAEKNNRINELEEEIEDAEADRLRSFNDSDAPPEVEEADVSPDAIPITKKAVADISREVRSLLGLSNKDMADVRSMIEEYSASETPDRAELYEKIEERFGEVIEKHIDEDLRGVKGQLRTYGINVEDHIKSEIADYGQLMRSNFGKVRFSKEGLPVDVAYEEFRTVLPGYFPADILSPTDQLLRIIEVANMDVASEQRYEIDAETLMQAADAIINGIGSFRQAHRAKAAGQESRAAFNGLMADADQHVPPIQPDDIAPIRTVVGSPKGVVAGQQTFNQTNATYDGVPSDDIAPLFDVSGKKGVPDGQQAFIEDAGVDKKITRKERHEAMVDDIKAKFKEKGFDFDKVLKKAKNLSTFATVDNTPQRVMEKALGYKEGQVLADMTVNKVAQNETEAIKWLNSFTNKKHGLLAQISKEYGIRPGSKKSAAAQMYAEGFYVDEDQNIVKYGDRELAIDFPDPKVRANIKRLAKDTRIRKIYDDTLASINESRVRNGYPEIPKLDNYFLHFRAMDDTFSKIGLPFNPNDIRAKDLPTDLNGVTADLKPGQPYFASAKHRKGKRTSFDMLGGLERYLASAKNQIYHIDDIQTLRALRDYIANTYGQAHGLEDLDTLSTQEAEERIEEVFDSHLSTFAKFLNEEANVLAGKTALIDRGVEGIIGRRGITFLNSLNKQVGANMVGFNISSSLTNFLAVSQAMAKTNKFDFVKGFTQMASNKITSIFGKSDGFVDSSPVMIRRKGADSFYRTPYQKVGDMGYVFMGMVDDISTELIARSKYNELTRKGMDSQQAHFETDKWVSRLMGDRSLGQQPQLYNSKMLGLLTKFQLEVRNQLDSQFYDTIQEAKVSSEHIQNGLLRNAKKAAKITSTFAQLAVLQHLFGKAFESVAGYNPAFDIIEILTKAFGWDDEEEDEDTVLDNLEQGFLELLGDLPYTSLMTGGRIPISSALPITELIKGEDQYGNEKSRWDTLTEVAPYYILPGGYGQFKKTKAGLEMFNEDHPIAGSYTDSGNLRFTVEDTPLAKAQAAVFGQYASELARDYFDNERKSLKENQIEELVDTGMPIRDYWKYRDELSKYEKWYDKADYIAGLDLPIETKNILINNISDRKERIDLTGYENYPNYEEFDWAKQNPEKYALLQKYGISAREYKAMDEDSKGAYTWAVNNPEAYTVSRAVMDDVVGYRRIVSEMWDIKADKDANGKSINGSRKAKVADYISGLDIGDAEKYILFKSEYNSDDSHNMEIINYLNDRDDLSSDDVVTILRYLGFTVDSQGYISW